MQRICKLLSKGKLTSFRFNDSIEWFNSQEVLILCKGCVNQQFENPKGILILQIYCMEANKVLKRQILKQVVIFER